MSDEQAAPAAEAPADSATDSATETVEAQDTTSGDVTVPLNEQASRKEQAIERLRAALRAENGEPEPADPILDAEPDEPFSVNPNDALKNAPDDIKKLYANMRADYTRKTQALAEARKQMEAERAALTNGKFMDDLKARAEADVGFDPFSPESVQAHIDKQVAAALRQALEPVRQEVELSNRRAQLERFKAENPDINQPEVKRAVVQMLKDDESLSLERAYAIVQGNRALTEKRALEAELARIRGEAKQAGLKIGGASRATGSGRVPAAIRQQGAWAVAQWIQANRK